jgi:hypothetical protein
LTHDELHALRAALTELSECKTLLERARGEE